VIHLPEFQQLAQEYRQLRQRELLRLELVLQPLVQEFQRQEPVQAHRQQELVLQLQHLLQLLQLQLF
jgi:hypothetical protein